MNILIAADYATPVSGNFIASCVELGRRLKKRQHTLSFIFPENRNTAANDSWTKWLEREGFKVFLFQKDRGGDAEYLFLKAVISDNEIELIHIHFGLFSATLRNHKRDLGVKVLVHDHMGAGVHTKRGFIKQRLQFALRSLVYRKNGISIICVNEQKAKAFIFAKHWYVPNGLSFLRNVHYSSSREECRQELGIADDERVCLFLGWEMYTKGLDIAAKAIENINASDYRLLLCIVGMGNAPDTKRIREISNMTGVDANSNWIRYLPSREDMFAYHRVSDVYLSASRSEGFSFGVLEAISQNKPVVVSDIDGTSWCHKYNKAIVYQTEDYKACADAIKQALALVNKDSNSEEIIKGYSIETWCNRIMHIYETL